MKNTLRQRLISLKAQYLISGLTTHAVKVYLNSGQSFTVNWSRKHNCVLNRFGIPLSFELGAVSAGLRFALNKHVSPTVPTWFLFVPYLSLRSLVKEHGGIDMQKTAEHLEELTARAAADSIIEHLRSKVS